ncbi:Tryptophan RNA-binding attenuator protein-like protein [Ophiocordyceps camponoti-floridani]|uniref:Tryptophan RNA-binding attenuator protein-like protein n=1 Tax=Ophiocordyceps camponoti-floridani TaxID=2030778 RepID=A0A8H4Q3E8_9HYPO|nr:Tryptophan RNA-binding attenuator protein-like protein [Ophiocordyceps camponoti-floridani]
MPTKLLEALKNPNWRQRRSSSESSSNADLEVTSHARSRSRYSTSGSFDSDKVEPDNINNRKISPIDRQFNTRNVAAAAAVTANHAPVRQDSVDDRRDELSGLCHVMRHQNLDPSLCGGYGPQLFELTLVDADDTAGVVNSLGNAAGVVHALTGLAYPVPLAMIRRFKPLEGSKASSSSSPSSSSIPAEHQRSAMMFSDENQTSGQVRRGQQVSRDLAWEKVIKKLNKSNGSVSKARSSRDSGYGTASGSEEQAAEGPPFVSYRHPVSHGGRRVLREQTASDHSITYGLEGACRIIEAQPVAPAKEPVISEAFKFRHDLNPKAREFLSSPTWSQQSLGKTGEAPMMTTQPTPAEKVTMTQLPAEPCPLYGPMSMPYHQALIPLPMPQPPGMPGTLQPLRPPPLVGLGNRLPPQPSWTNGAGQGFGTGPMAGPPNVDRPAPVPKPRVPNACDQQAYEAYIEQRKATEPGYAMECRLRQQRRAKRGHPGRVQYEAAQLLMLRGKA